MNTDGFYVADVLAFATQEGHDNGKPELETAIPN